MLDPDVCPICNNPKASKSSGSLTQWISTCTCDLAGESDGVDEAPVVLCKDCGKRVNQGRSGSLTQYIFRSDVCQCEKPNIPDYLKSFEPLSARADQIIEEEEFEELDYEIDGFPYERYNPLKELGAGASSSVFLAQDKLLNKMVAVKLLHFVENKQLIAFHEEAKATSQLDHPAIVKLLDFGASESEIPYMVLEYLQGESLESKLNRDGQFSWMECQKIFSDILSGIQYAHENGIFHRDIKPSNIILLKKVVKSSIKIIDFGVAKVAEESAYGNKENIVGAPLYMSPDQGSGLPFDSRSEIYSLGCVLYECLSGRPPFNGETPIETLVMHAKEIAVPVSELVDNIPEQLEKVVFKALDKDPDRRYQSAHEFRQDIVSIVVDKEIEEVATEEGSISETESLKRAVVFSALGGIILLMMFFGVYFLTQQKAAEPKPKAAKDKKDSFKAFPIPAAEIDETYKQLKLDQEGWTVEKNNIYIGKSVTDDDFKELQGKRVLGIRVQHSKVTGEGLKYVDENDLRLLSIVSQIFDEKGASLVPRFKKLNTLRIHATDKLTNKAIEYLISAPRLRSIEIRYTNNFPSKALSIISTNERLVRLDIGQCKPVTHEEFAKIANMKELFQLRFPLTDIDDSYIDTILKTKIKFLEIADSKISDKGLEKLARLKTLKEVIVNQYNTPITLKGLQKLHRLNPKVSIVVNDGPAIDTSFTRRGQSGIEDLSERARRALRRK